MHLLEWKAFVLIPSKVMIIEKMCVTYLLEVQQLLNVRVVFCFQTLKMP
jgi:hypothetical protein